MKHSLSVVLAASAIVGLAFARVSSPQDPVERLATVEKEVAALKTQVAELTKVGGEPGTDDVALRAQLLKQQETLDKVLLWGHAQAEAATGLQAALDDAQARGFVAGINPESRIVLLDGFHSLATALKTELPPPAPTPEAAPAPAPAPKAKKDV
jgi:uncharacterized protein (UPF0261 family)